MTLEQIRYWRCMSLAIEEQLHENVQPTPERTLVLLERYLKNLPALQGVDPKPIFATINFERF